MSVDEGIRRFWGWWEEARHRVERAIEVERAFSDELVAEISSHVAAIGGDLDWELSPGRTAHHAFCLSGKGDPDARLLTELWRHRGPPADATWEYFTARQGVQGSRIRIDDVELDRDELAVAFEVDRGRERIDARYYHPRFADLTEQTRLTAVFLLLDGALGEDGVERWLGSIEAAPEQPDGAVTFAEFREALAELERTATGEKFVIMKGTTEDGEPLFVTCNQALKRIDHLLHTMHVAIDLAILDQNEQGLTTPADAEQLNRLEDELSGALKGLAVYFGRETRPGHRVLHWYLPDDSAGQGIIERWAKQHPERRPQVAWMRDPGWELVRHFV